MASKNRLDQAAGASIGGFFSKADESKPEQSVRESQKPPYTDEQIGEALKTVYRTGKQQDEADYLQINKDTFSKKIREIEKKEPERVERLKAEVAAEQVEEKAEEKAKTKTQKQSFSFRADLNKIENWKLYAETIGTKDIGTLWTAAIDEYISNHALTADQQTIYDLKKKAAEMAKKQK